jgi:hypothetical protein
LSFFNPISDIFSIQFLQSLTFFNPIFDIIYNPISDVFQSNIWHFFGPICTRFDIFQSNIWRYSIQYLTFFTIQFSHTCSLSRWHLFAGFQKSFLCLSFLSMQLAIKSFHTCTYDLICTPGLVGIHFVSHYRICLPKLLFKCTYIY